jgi:hypothetical protein
MLIVYRVKIMAFVILLVCEAINETQSQSKTGEHYTSSFIIECSPSIYVKLLFKKS